MTVHRVTQAFVQYEDVALRKYQKLTPQQAARVGHREKLGKLADRERALAEFEMVQAARPLKPPRLR